MSTPAGQDAEPLFSVSAGNPTPAELAAVTAVIEGMAREIEASRRAGDEGPSDWERSRRPVAVEIAPGPGAWSRSPC